MCYHDNLVGMKRRVKQKYGWWGWWRWWRWWRWKLCQRVVWWNMGTPSHWLWVSASALQETSCAEKLMSNLLRRAETVSLELFDSWWTERIYVQQPAVWQNISRRQQHTHGPNSTRFQRKNSEFLPSPPPSSLLLLLLLLLPLLLKWREDYTCDSLTITIYFKINHELWFWWLIIKIIINDVIRGSWSFTVKLSEVIKIIWLLTLVLD